MTSIVSVDIGTTQTKAVLVSTNGIINHAQESYSLIKKNQVIVEQRIGDLEKAITSSIKKLLIMSSEYLTTIKGIVFTGQMQNIIPIGKNGAPLTNMISWLDARGKDYANDVIWKGHLKVKGYPLRPMMKFLNETGGAPGYTGKDTIAKLGYLKNHKPEIYYNTRTFLDCKDYAIYFASGKVITTPDTAFITWLLKLQGDSYSWSTKIHQFYDLDIRKMPKIVNSPEIVGPISKEFAEKTGLPVNLPIIAGAGDMPASAIGSGAILPGTLHINIGTAGWIGCHFPKQTKDIKHYVGTIVAGIPSQFFILSKQETLGKALDWLISIFYPDETQVRDNRLYEELENMAARSPPGANGVFFTPWLIGERSPINDPSIRAQFMNLSLSTTRADMIRSVMEGVAFNIKWGKEYVDMLSKKFKNNREPYIRMIGGAANSNLWCQIFADVLNCPIAKMQDPLMASALGAAVIGFYGLGIYKSFHDIEKIVKIERIFSPQSESVEVYRKKYTKYTKIYGQLKNLF